MNGGAQAGAAICVMAAWIVAYVVARLHDEGWRIGWSRRYGRLLAVPVLVRPKPELPKVPPSMYDRYDTIRQRYGTYWAKAEHVVANSGDSSLMFRHEHPHAFGYLQAVDWYLESGDPTLVRLIDYMAGIMFAKEACGYDGTGGRSDPKDIGHGFVVTSDERTAELFPAVYSATRKDARAEPDGVAAEEVLDTCSRCQQYKSPWHNCVKEWDE
jgi:hypothetical protein